MELSLPPGNNSVELELPRDWFEQAGPWVSLSCLVLAMVIALTERSFSRSADLGLSYSLC